MKKSVFHKPKLLLFLLCPFIILSAGSSELITGKDGKTYSSHSLRWFEVDASKRGAKHFDKKYGNGEGEDYFDIKSFRTSNPSKYQNPRNGGYNTETFLTSGAIVDGWEYCFVWFVL